MIGDRVEIVVDAGGTTRSWEVAATRAGRRVEVAHGRGVVEVSEVTRGGTPVRTARFMSSRVLALVEHPAVGGGAPRRRRAARPAAAAPGGLSSATAAAGRDAARCGPRG